MGAFYRAIRDRKRAEAWFQIRYCSLGKWDQYVEGKAKARYIESQVFGLYDDPNNVSPEEAHSVFEMFQRHRAEIAQYEARFGLRFDGTDGTRNMISEGNDDPDYQHVLAYFGLNRIDTIGQALDYGKTALVAGLITEYQNAGMPELLSRLGNADEFRSVDIYVRPTSGTRFLAGDLTWNNLMLGSDWEDRLSGGNENDVLIGEGGHDWLRGWAGSDVLVGGPGSDMLIGDSGDDFLYGGADNDFYYIFSSDGSGTDRIEDKEGLNTVFVDYVPFRRFKRGAARFCSC